MSSPRRRPRPSRLYDPSVWHRDHRVGLALILASTAVIVIVGFLGPSAVTLSLGPKTSGLPPWHLAKETVHLNEWVGALALYLSISAGAVGLWVTLRAVADGWRPGVWRLFGLGAVLNVLISLVPPMTSADVLMYAAYGRLQSIGRDPYEITTALIFRSQFDPVLHLTEQPWQETPSVYGPIVSFTQETASRLGGESMHDIVFWLQLMSLIPMLLVGAVVVRMARGNPLLQLRATLFTVLNPALIWAVTAQAHNEPLAVVFAVGAIALMRRSPFVAGILIGLAGGVKINMVLYGVAMLWAYRRDRRSLVQLLVGTLLPLVACYILWQPTALFAALRNTSYVNSGAWAAPVFKVLTWFMGATPAKIIINIVALALWAVIGFMLSKVLPWRPLPGMAPEVEPLHDPMTIAVRTSAILYVSWLVTTPNSFSWYDLLAWAPLALCTATRLDTLLLWRTTWLSLAFVTGRAIEFSPALGFVGARIRDTLCVIAQVIVLVVIVRWYRERFPSLDPEPVASAEIALPPAAQAMPGPAG